MWITYVYIHCNLVSGTLFIIHFFFLKFTYSEKATKFFEISSVDLTGASLDKSTVEILQNFVAFSKYKPSLSTTFRLWKDVKTFVGVSTRTLGWCQPIRSTSIPKCSPWKVGGITHSQLTFFYSENVTKIRLQGTHFHQLFSKTANLLL